MNCEHAKHNSECICLSIGLHTIAKCDVYCLRIPLDKTEYARLCIPKGTFAIYNGYGFEKHYDKPPAPIDDCSYEGLSPPPWQKEHFGADGMKMQTTGTPIEQLFRFAKCS